jgi:adenine-specific DNA methylase
MTNYIEIHGIPAYKRKALRRMSLLSMVGVLNPTKARLILRSAIAPGNATEADITSEVDILPSPWKRPPRILDPFSGWGTFPLLASKLGIPATSCDSDGLAILDQVARLYYPTELSPQFFETLIEIIKEISGKTASEIEAGFSNECGDRIDRYHWVFTKRCPNCEAIVPLMKSYDFSVGVNDVNHIELTFEGSETNIKIKEGKAYDSVGPYHMGKMTCPVCKMTTAVEGKLSPRCLFYSFKKEGGKPRKFKVMDEDGVAKIKKSEDLYDYLNDEWNDRGLSYSNKLPSNRLNKRGISTWEDIFLKRQLLTLKSLQSAIISCISGRFRSSLEEEAARVYLALVFSRVLEWNCIYASYSIPGVYRPALERGSIGSWYPSEFVEVHPSKDNLFDLIRGILDIDELKHTAMDLKTIPEFRVALADDTRLNNQSADLIFLDPPYIDTIDYQGFREFHRVWLEKFGIKSSQFDLVLSEPFFSMDMTREPSEIKSLSRYYEYYSVVLKEMQRVLHEEGLLVILHNNLTETHLLQLVRCIIKENLLITSVWPCGESEQKSSRLSSEIRPQIVITCRKKTGSEPSRTISEIQREILIEIDDKLSAEMNRSKSNRDLAIVLFGRMVSKLSGVRNANELLESIDLSTLNKTIAEKLVQNILSDVEGDVDDDSA